MARVAVIGGGLAGLAAAAALGDGGHEIDVYEARPYFGGRAASYPLPGTEGGHIDNCQHILLGCCVNLLDFYRRLGVQDKILFHRKFYFLEPGGRLSTLKPGWLPTPMHFASSFLKLKFLTWSDKAAIAQAMVALRRERLVRKDLDRITMLEWLKEKSQPRRAIERFWRQVLVSAVNEELDRMAAIHGFQVFWLGFLSGPRNAEMGVPGVPLGELYSEKAWAKKPNVRLHPRTSIDQIRFENGRATGLEADYYVSAVPFERLQTLAPELGVDVTGFSHSPITGIHLWFDRPITALPHATLLDRAIQWFFNKGDGRYLMVVVSASRSLVEMDRKSLIDLAVRELSEFLPEVRKAALTKAHVVKELRATFSAVPGMEAKRPPTHTRIPNLYLAGDWTRSGWPATMEGAVRSGYLAAEAVTRAAGQPKRFLL
jgi:zeta-carotene desaturase